LYTDCVVALDADSGRLKWYFQFTPHDDFDFDSVQVPVLADLDWKGARRRVMLWANRNGYFYVLDRTTGEFLQGTPFAKVTWAKGLDEKGRPMRAVNMVPTPEGTKIYPGNQGGTNWYSPSYSPHTGLFYIPTWDNYYSVYVKEKVEFAEGRLFTGPLPKSPVPLIRPPQIVNRAEEDGYGAIRAFDPQTGERKWEYKMSDVTDSGILTTATDLLFVGGREGYFMAMDARNGELLWKSVVGGQVSSGPMSYSVSGKQYVAISAGNSLFVYGLR
jgi:alcohol dehydrogenase (cytochrome c)